MAGRRLKQKLGVELWEGGSVFWGKESWWKWGVREEEKRELYIKSQINLLVVLVAAAAVVMVIMVVVVIKQLGDYIYDPKMDGCLKETG